MLLCSYVWSCVLYCACFCKSSNSNELCMSNEKAKEEIQKIVAISSVDMLFSQVQKTVISGCKCKYWYYRDSYLYNGQVSTRYDNPNGICNLKHQQLHEAISFQLHFFFQTTHHKKKHICEIYIWPTVQFLDTRMVKGMEVIWGYIWSFNNFQLCGFSVFPMFTGGTLFLAYLIFSLSLIISQIFIAECRFWGQYYFHDIHCVKHTLNINLKEMSSPGALYFMCWDAKVNVTSFFVPLV